MPALLSPRSHCLHCSKVLPADRQAKAGTKLVIGFCSDACSLNYGVQLASAPKRERLTSELVRLLASIQEGGLGGVYKVPEDCEGALKRLAKKGLVQLHGRFGASPTLRGDISYVRTLAMGSEAPQDPEDEAALERQMEILAEVRREQEAELAFMRMYGSDGCPDF